MFILGFSKAVHILNIAHLSNKKKQDSEKDKKDKD